MPDLYSKLFTDNPGGMLMPGRVYSSTSGYRYGFNTQEFENEISGTGNHTSALKWEYDTRLVRRWNLDPIYTHNESRYVTNGNNPIFHTDPLGDFKTKFGAYWYKITRGVKGSVGRNENKKSERHGEWFIQRASETIRDKSGDNRNLSELVFHAPIYGGSGRKSNDKQAQSGGGTELPLFKYAGDQSKYPGAIVVETSLMSRGAVTLPPFVFTAPGRGKNQDLMRHEHGHILQYVGLSVLSGSPVTGYGLYLLGIGVPSIFSADKANNDPNHFHQGTFTEKSANQLEYWFLGRPADWKHTYKDGKPAYPVYWK